MNITNKDVLFIDGSGVEGFEKLSNQNALREEDIENIMEVYQAYESKEKFSHLARIEEIKKMITI